METVRNGSKIGLAKKAGLHLDPFGSVPDRFLNGPV